MRPNPEEDTPRRPARPAQPSDQGYPQESEPFDPLAYAAYEEPEQSLLRNPYVLAGLAVAASIFLAVFVVIFFGGSSGEGSGPDGSSSNSNNVVVNPLTPQAGRGVTARSISPATVREGPAPEFLEIAPLRTGQDVEVIGRNQQSSWFQIYYPVGSQLKGWVVASALRLPDGSLERLAVTVATPIPRPTVALPTPTAEPAATATATPTVPATPAGGPDLTLSIARCQIGQAVVVTIRNAGEAAATNRQVRVTIASGQGVLGVADTLITLGPGASANLTTNQAAQPGLMVARIDLIGTPPDPNPGNNSAQCSGGAGIPGQATPVR